MGIVPGTEPGPYQEEPLLAEEPLPPGEEQRIEEVDQIAKDVRASGSKEAEAADEKADAVEGEGQHEGGEEKTEDGEPADGPGDGDETGDAASDADAGADPTDDGEGADDPD